MAHFCKVPEGTKISVLRDTTVTTEGCIYIVMKEDNSFGTFRTLSFITKSREEACDYAHNHGGKLFWSTEENWKECNWARILRTSFMYRNFNEVGFASTIPVGGYGITPDYNVVVHCNEGFVYWDNDDKLVFDECAPNVLVAYSNTINRERTDRTLKEDNIWVTIHHGVYALVEPLGVLTGVNGEALNNSRFKTKCNIMRIPPTLSGDKLLPWAECYPFNTYNMSYRTVIGPLSFGIKNGDPYVTCDMSVANRYGVKEKISVPLTRVSMCSSMTYACGVVYSYFNFTTVVDSDGDVFDPLSERWCHVFGTSSDGSIESITKPSPDDVGRYFINIDGKLVSRFTVLLRRNEEGKDYYTVLDGCDGKNFFDCDITCDVDFYVDGEYKRCTWDEYRCVFILYEDTVKAFCNRNNLDYEGWSNGGYVYDREIATCPSCGNKYIKLETRYSLYGVFKYVDGDLVEEALVCPHCFKRFCEFHEPITVNGKTYYRTEYEVYDNYIVPKDDLIWDDEGELYLKDNLLTWDVIGKEWEIPDGRILIDGPRGIKQLHEKFCCHVASYCYKPTPIFCKGETEDTEKFFGVELELMYGGESDRNVAKICKDIPFIYVKHDGSLDDGIELVSHPCTLTYHKNEFGWDKILERAKDLGYEAPSGSGIHVHLSRAFWTKQDKENMIAFIITFCDLHREALRAYAGRDSYEFDKWTQAYMSRSNTEEAVERMFGNYSTIKDISASLYRSYARATCHYSGVNLSNSNTVEFRFFHSSTNPVRLTSILQFVDCLSDMSLNVTKETMINFERIKEYATDKGYTELLNDPYFVDACEYDENHPVRLNLGRQKA